VVAKYVKKGNLSKIGLGSGFYGYFAAFSEIQNLFTLFDEIILTPDTSISLTFCTFLHFLNKKSFLFRENILTP